MKYVIFIELCTDAVNNMMPLTSYNVIVLTKSKCLNCIIQCIYLLSLKLDTVYSKPNLEGSHWSDLSSLIQDMLYGNTHSTTQINTQHTDRQTSHCQSQSDL